MIKLKSLLGGSKYQLSEAALDRVLKHIVENHVKFTTYDNEAEMLKEYNEFQNQMSNTLLVEAQTDPSDTTETGESTGEPIKVPGNINEDAEEWVKEFDKLINGWGWFGSDAKIVAKLKDLSKQQNIAMLYPAIDALWKKKYSQSFRTAIIGDLIGKDEKEGLGILDKISPEAQVDAANSMAGKIGSGVIDAVKAMFVAAYDAILEPAWDWFAKEVPWWARLLVYRWLFVTAYRWVMRKTKLDTTKFYKFTSGWWMNHAVRWWRAYQLGIIYKSGLNKIWVYRVAFWLKPEWVRQSLLKSFRLVIRQNQGTTKMNVLARDMAEQRIKTVQNMAESELLAVGQSLLWGELKMLFKEMLKTLEMEVAKAPAGMIDEVRAASIGRQMRILSENAPSNLFNQQMVTIWMKDVFKLSGENLKLAWDYYSGTTASQQLRAMTRLSKPNRPLSSLTPGGGSGPGIP